MAAAPAVPNLDQYGVEPNGSIHAQRITELLLLLHPDQLWLERLRWNHG